MITYRDLVLHFRGLDGRMETLELDPVIDIPRPGPVPPLPNPSDTVMVTYECQVQMLNYDPTWWHPHDPRCVDCGGRLKTHNAARCDDCYDELGHC